MSEKPPAFQFYPREFLTSEAVVCMTPEQRGGYIMLLCHAWLADTPGVLPDDDKLLASLSGLGRRWNRCSGPIKRAWSVTHVTGCWSQMRMVEERERQLTRSEQARKGAEATNGQRTHSARTAGRTATALHLHLQSATATAHQEPMPVPSAPRAIPSQPPGFEAFWQAYPRRIGKASAMRSYARAIKAGVSPETIVAAVTAAKASADWRKDSGQFIPHPTTWLNQGRWDDQHQPTLSGMTTEERTATLTRWLEDKNRDRS